MTDWEGGSTGRAGAAAGGGWGGEVGRWEAAGMGELGRMRAVERVGAGEASGRAAAGVGWTESTGR
ncbi:hypothetical protein B1218_35035 [Pseudomonas ogarae]|nr:hypothetical protein B1218_35035 [Pseudomonas ogarae]